MQFWIWLLAATAGPFVLPQFARTWRSLSIVALLSGAIILWAWVQHTLTDYAEGSMNSVFVLMSVAMISVSLPVGLATRAIALAAGATNPIYRQGLAITLAGVILLTCLYGLLFNYAIP